MDDGNYVPRVNGSNIFDFENSVVNIIYTSAPNPFAGALRVLGYLIITSIDVLALNKYVTLLLFIAYLLCRSEVWSAFPWIWNRFNAWCLDNKFKLPVARATSPSSTPATTTACALPDIEIPARRPSWAFSMWSLKLSPASWKFAYQKYPVVPSAPPPTPAGPSNTTRKSGRQPTFKTPPSSPKVSAELFAWASSFKIPVPAKQSPPDTETAPIRTSPRTAAAAKKYPPIIEAAPEKTLPSEVVPAKQSPPKTSEGSAAHSGAPAAGTPFQPWSNEINEESNSWPRTPSTESNTDTESNESAGEPVNWFLELGKKLFAMIWSHISTLLLTGLALVSVYYYIDAVPNVSNSGSVASIFDGWRPGNLVQPINDYAHGILESLWSFAIVIFNSLWSFTTVVFNKIVAVTAFAGYSTLNFFYQTLWTFYSRTFLVVATFVAASITAFSFGRIRLLAVLLLIGGSISYCGAVCLHSAAITALSLVGIALAAWATQSFTDFTKKISPHIAGIPFSFLTWQPVFWTTIFWISHYFHYFSLTHLFQFRRRDADFWFSVFLFLAIWKGLKIFIHTFSYYLWTRPAQAPQNPTITPADVTVIVPTICNFEQEFLDCILSILANQPAKVIISVVGYEKRMEAIQACEKINPRIEVVSVSEANKRTQLIKAVENVRTEITVYADDHVFWPTTFLRSALAPFEDPIVGLVGTSRRVRRNRKLPFLDNFFNYIACIYLERHNFECTATYNIDGGVFVISGRTGLVRTSAIHSLEYRTEFQNEYFGNTGPMKVDDDNFNTRFMVRHGYKVVFHNDPKATIETTLVHDPGQLTKFRGQLLRWARTTWRSNLKSLITDRACYQSIPWTTYAMFLSSFTNFALIYDALLFITLSWSGSNYMPALVMVLLLTKLIKPLPHLMRERDDWWFVPGGILFGYLHGFIRLYAFVTMDNVEWSGRSGIKATA
jgi:cellulose synthase/poly-beta-1,6-N-acetylglucosamine synthase-like glycosyltransferase